MIEVVSYAPYPGSALSNFADHKFVFDDARCSSMEGLLQAFKFQDHAVQRNLCSLTGVDAKFVGKRGDGWKANQLLWWKSVAFDRASEEYQQLLDRAYLALLKNNDFSNALTSTGDEALVHLMGSEDPTRTVLTNDEFLTRLIAMRALLEIRKG